MNAATDHALLAPPAVGIVPGMPIETYHALPPVSNSGLNDFARSPHHFFHLHRNPFRPAPEPKQGHLEGQLAHCAILEPGEFLCRYKVAPVMNRNTKVWKQFVEDNPRHVCIQTDQADTALAQARSVATLPEVEQLLSRGRPEVSAFWLDEATGLACRCRPDFVHPIDDRRVILVDVKTCGDASTREFGRQVARKGYHRQAAFYSDGYAAAAGVEVVGFVFVAVEMAWPYAASAVMLDDEGLAQGRADYRALLERLAECERANKWPGYCSTVEQITLPRWAVA
jgi:hypothetical protein